MFFYIAFFYSTILSLPRRNLSYRKNNCAYSFDMHKKPKKLCTLPKYAQKIEKFVHVVVLCTKKLYICGINHRNRKRIVYFTSFNSPVTLSIIKPLTTTSFAMSG